MPNALIPRINYERLAKFMGRATSDYDSEALTGLRQANALLRKGGSNWSVLILEVLCQGLKKADKKVEDLDDPAKIIEQVLLGLRECKHITAEQHSELVLTVRMVLVSRDTNFHRRFGKKFRDMFSRAK